MVVLREEYYMSLVKHIQEELKLSMQKEDASSAQRRSNSFQGQFPNYTQRSISSFRKKSPSSVRKPPIQRASSLSALRTIEKFSEQPNASTKVVHTGGAERLSDLSRKRSNSEKVLRLPNTAYSQPSFNQKGRELNLSPRPSSEIKTTRTQFLREISSQRRILEMQKKQGSGSRQNSRGNSTRVPIFDQLKQKEDFK